MRGAARTRVAACLHALVDEKEVIALARGEQRGAKREAVDFPFDAEPAANAPDFGNVEGDANDDPPETRLLHAFQRGREGLPDGVGLCFHTATREWANEKKKGTPERALLLPKSFSSKRQRYFEKLATAS